MTWPRPFHEQVRAVRMMRGLAQSDLAELLGLSRPRAAAVESGDHGPQLAKAVEIAEVLDCTLVVLLVPNELTGEGVAGSVPLRGLKPGPMRGSRLLGPSGLDDDDEA